MQNLTYQDSGVDLNVYAESMSRLPKLAKTTFNNRVMRLDGGFAGLFKLNGADSQYADPVLVSCTDGVGTKLKIAFAMDRHNSVGIDLVAMSVNDALCCGAEPLFFLDYVAMPKDDPDKLEAIVSGIAEGCRQGGCALLGGETAILSDMYAPGEYDLAGFCVGVAERSQIIDGKAICSGDALIGVASSGLHSNGFSLVRKAVFDAAKLKIDTFVPELNTTVGEALLCPTRIYAHSVKAVLEIFGANDGIRGIAHITGGGLEENISRILPPNVSLQINKNSWTIPQIFKWIQQLGNIEDTEMARVFNLGIGLVFIVKPNMAQDVIRSLQENGENAWLLGHV